MNTDIRVATSFPFHRKTLALIALCGEAGPFRLVCLWSWAADNRPDGQLSGLDSLDLERASGWKGKKNAFISALVEVGFLDGEAPSFSLHDWQEHNAYALHAPERSAAAKRAADARWNARRNAPPMPSASKGHDAPSPYPDPYPKKKTNTSSNPPERTAVRAVVSRERSDTETALFEFWRWWMEKPAAKFTSDRRMKIRGRLSDGYSPALIAKGIIGCADNPFNRGENDRHREYLDLTLICRTGSKLEGYIADFRGNLDAQIARFRQDGFTEAADRLAPSPCAGGGSSHGGAGPLGEALRVGPDA